MAHQPLLNYPNGGSPPKRTTAAEKVSSFAHCSTSIHEYRSPKKIYPFPRRYPYYGTSHILSSTPYPEWNLPNYPQRNLPVNHEQSVPYHDSTANYENDQPTQLELERPNEQICEDRISSVSQKAVEPVVTNTTMASMNIPRTYTSPTSSPKVEYNQGFKRSPSILYKNPGMYHSNEKNSGSHKRNSSQQPFAEMAQRTSNNYTQVPASQTCCDHWELPDSNRLQLTVLQQAPQHEQGLTMGVNGFPAQLSQFYNEQNLSRGGNMEFSHPRRIYHHEAPVTMRGTMRALSPQMPRNYSGYLENFRPVQPLPFSYEPIVKPENYMKTRTTPDFQEGPSNSKFVMAPPSPNRFFSPNNGGKQNADCLIQQGNTQPVPIDSQFWKNQTLPQAQVASEGIGVSMGPQVARKPWFDSVENRDVQALGNYNIDLRQYNHLPQRCAPNPMQNTALLQQRRQCDNFKYPYFWIDERGVMREQRSPVYYSNFNGVKPTLMENDNLNEAVQNTDIREGEANGVLGHNLQIISGKPENLPELPADSYGALLGTLEESDIVSYNFLQGKNFEAAKGDEQSVRLYHRMEQNELDESDCAVNKGQNSEDEWKVNEEYSHVSPTEIAPGQMLQHKGGTFFTGGQKISSNQLSEERDMNFLSQDSNPAPTAYSKTDGLFSCESAVYPREEKCVLAGSHCNTADSPLRYKSMEFSGNTGTSLRNVQNNSPSTRQQGSKEDFDFEGKEGTSCMDYRNCELQPPQPSSSHGVRIIKTKTVEDDVERTSHRHQVSSPLISVENTKLEEKQRTSCASPSMMTRSEVSLLEPMRKACPMIELEQDYPLSTELTGSYRRNDLNSGLRARIYNQTHTSLVAAPSHIGSAREYSIFPDKLLKEASHSHSQEFTESIKTTESSNDLEACRSYTIMESHFTPFDKGGPHPQASQKPPATKQALHTMKPEQHFSPDHHFESAVTQLLALRPNVDPTEQFDIFEGARKSLKKSVLFMEVGDKGKFSASVEGKAYRNSFLLLRGIAESLA